MAITNFPMYIEIYQPIREQIRAKQEDANSRFLDITLLDQGSPFNLINNDVFLFAIKPDGTKVYNNCPIVNAELGNFKCELTSQLLAVPGCVKAEFIVFGFDGIEILKTFTFIIDVMPMVYNTSAIESANEFDAVTGALKDINSVRALIRNISDRLGWPWPEDISQTIFDWFRWLKIYLEQTFAALNQNIANRFTILHNLLGTPGDVGDSNSGTFFGRINYIVSMFTNWWTTTRAGYIDDPISSRSSQSSVNDLQTQVNYLQSQIHELGSNIKSVQRMTFTYYSSSGWPYPTIQYTNISPVDLSKSVLIANGNVSTEWNTHVLVKIYFYSNSVVAVDVPFYGNFQCWGTIQVVEFK